MVYDPKKKRPSRQSLDAVVDEIFGEDDMTSSTKTGSEKPKSSGAKKPASKKAETKKTPKPQAKTTQNTDETITAEEPDNVLPLYPQDANTPLIMQPQVWLATGIAAVMLLFLVRRRKKK